MEKIEIGVAGIEYKENGEVKNAYFQPTMQLEINVDDIQNITLLSGLKNPKSEQDVVKASEHVFAAWFNKVTEIEMVDMGENKIESEVILCDKWPNGNIKTCKIKFSLEKIE